MNLYHWEQILLGRPLSGCFRPNAAGLLEPSAVMPQVLRKHVMPDTSKKLGILYQGFCLGFTTTFILRKVSKLT